MPYEPLDQSVVRYDELGRPYWAKLSGGRFYISPVAAMSMHNEPRAVDWARRAGAAINPDGSVTNNAAPDGSLFRQRGRWDPDTGNFEQPINWGNVANIGVGSFLTAGAINAFTGPAAAAGGAQAPLQGIPAGTLPGGAAAPAVTPGMAASGAAPIPGIAAGTLPGGAAAPVVSPGMSSYGTPVTSLASAPSYSVVDKLKKMITTPDGVKSLVSLIPALSSLRSSGGGNSFKDTGLEDEIRESLALQRKRLEQTQPVYDTLVNMAYGGTPTRYRGNAPAGYTPSPGPQGAYQYESPRFGGRS